MSWVTSRISPMRAPAASSSANVGTRAGACAPTPPAPARAARQTSRKRLIDGRAGFAHHAAPLFVLGAHERAQLLWPHRRGVDPGGAEVVLHLGIAQRL